MECFFACLLDMPDHSIPDYALLQNVMLLVLGQIQKSLVTNMPNIQSCEPNNIQIGIFVYIFSILCITPRGHIKLFCISSS